VIDHGKLVAAGTVEQIRAHVSRKSILCRSNVALETMRAWRGVLQVTEKAGRQQIVTQEAETVLRQLLGADPGVSDIEVRGAGLGDALAALTSDDASGSLQ
jgi:ABC-2 type transport system ATP-binding protein